MSTYEPIHLPDYAWTDTAVLAACQARDANRLLTIVHRKYGVTQERLGHFIGVINAHEVNKRINGRKTGHVESLYRWQAIANALNMPDYPRWLIGLASTTPPDSRAPASHAATNGVHAPDDNGAQHCDLARRAFLQGMIASSVVSLAAVTGAPRFPARTVGEPVVEHFQALRAVLVNADNLLGPYYPLTIVASRST